jgi:hypothetical protein
VLWTKRCLVKILFSIKLQKYYLYLFRFVREAVIWTEGRIIIKGKKSIFCTISDLLLSEFVVIFWLMIMVTKHDKFNRKKTLLMKVKCFSIALPKWSLITYFSLERMIITSFLSSNTNTNKSLNSNLFLNFFFLLNSFHFWFKCSKFKER